MRKICYLLLMVLCLQVNAQGYRTMSVWSNGSHTDKTIVDIDSISFADDGSITVFSGNQASYSASEVDSITLSVPDVTSTNKKTVKELRTKFNAVKVKTNSFKATTQHSPLMGHKFGADPFGMVDGNRLYVYMTDDHLYRSTDGQPITGAYDYSDCKNVTIISSEDLVNWTDHGTQPVAGSGGPASWAGNMWAPCAAHKTINGKEKYFLYFSNNSNGIGVLTSDSPYGPWAQPSNLSGALINHNTPTCSSSQVPSVYDPAVLIDDDGKAYLYFGGGTDNLDLANPGSARCVQLGDNMVSIVGEPVQIKPPYHFEDSGINKIGGKYLYSYCAHFQTGGGSPGNGNIGYMKSDNPLGPFTYVGKCFDNPGGSSWAGGGGNNHHAIVEFQGKYYMLYHNRALKSAMRSSNPDINDNVELRSTCINEIKVDTVKGTITALSASDLKQTIKQVKNFDPYKTVPGATMAWELGVTTTYQKYSSKYICTADLKSGSWLGLSRVDFGEGAKAFKVKAMGTGILKICYKEPDDWGEEIAYVEVSARGYYDDFIVPLVKETKGVKGKVFIVSSGNISIQSWSFVK